MEMENLKQIEFVTEGKIGVVMWVEKLRGHFNFRHGKMVMKILFEVMKMVLIIGKFNFNEKRLQVIIERERKLSFRQHKLWKFYALRKFLFYDRPMEKWFIHHSFN